ncbi:MAG: hypothetical protein A2075_12140 [Geobacteraceae bacterium GWC2_58_44]|nr:MAG: hypothetical protein A2075_12140 [Geobacteraceae bacterium GWC2_58_44]HBG06312.1 hypothetical protein [Geobacter sp.]
MNYAAGQFYLNLVITLVNLIFGVYVIWTNREKNRNARFHAVETRMSKAETAVDVIPEVKADLKKLDVRVIEAERAVAAMPVCANHHRMESNDKQLFVRLDDLHGDVREMVGGVKGLTNQLRLINEHLLKGGK